MKNEEKVKQGKQNRIQGKQLEIRVRKDLEEKGWIVDRWNNNVEFRTICGGVIKSEIKEGFLIQAKAKWNNFTKSMMTGVGGFPDFVAFRDSDTEYRKEVIGVECKISGKLDTIEKEKCMWLLENHVFSKILIAKKTKIKNKIVIEYNEFNR